jgi:hypothetical protein
MAKKLSQKVTIAHIKKPAQEKPPWLLVSESVRLQDVRLIDCRSHVEPEASKGKRPYLIERSTGVDTSSESFISVIATFALRSPSDADPNKFIIDIGASFLLIYKVNDAKTFDAEALKQFADANGTFNAWPYWREFVQSITTRMGLAPLIVPVWRIGGSPEQRQQQLPDGAPMPTQSKNC